MAERFALDSFDDTSPCFAEIVRLYQRIWPLAAGREDGAEATMRRHTMYPGFRSLVALTPDGAVAGFIYGTTDLPGQWWHERIAPMLGPADTARYLTGSFAVTTLAVAPERRRQGLGGSLHDALLAEVPQRMATLSTEVDNVPALSLYRQRGWRPIVERMRFAADGPEYVILSRTLT